MAVVQDKQKMGASGGAGGGAISIAQIASSLGLHNLTPQLDASRAASVGYACDVLSDVLAKAPAGSVLVTVQNHLNVVAVAVHAQLAAVIFAAGQRPDATAIARALEHGVILLASELPAFEVSGRLWQLGVRGGA
jgi:hypothetical protein